MVRSHVITFDQQLQIMNTEMKKPSTLLHRSAGNASCCIFRVPQSLVEINKEAYQPRIVSIGPYHYGNKDLAMIQEHKWRYLHDSIHRTGKSLDVFLNVIASLDIQIRQSYSESIDGFSKYDLAKIMVLDGFFLIELFRKAAKLIETDRDDPIFKMVWVSPFLMRDFLRIENQIPFFVLTKLFDESNLGTNDPSRTLTSLILEFFNHAVDRPKEVLQKYENLEGKHLLDFFRKSFINIPNENLQNPAAHVVIELGEKLDCFGKSSINSNNENVQKPATHKLIQPATKLGIAGVKFKVNHKANSFLNIEFQNGVLLIPHINMDDFYSSFFLNCVAFEQCYHHCKKDITNYAVFMGCLMNTSADVGLLSERKVIENYFGTDKEIATFFKNIGKDVAFDIKTNYLLEVFTEVNRYCKSGLHVHWAGFKHTYFASPWTFISALAALSLLVLALLQTIFTIRAA